MPFCPTFESAETHSLTAVEQQISLVMYITVTSIGAALNLAVITIVTRFREVQTAIHFIILNLAVADLLISVFCVPFTFWPNILLGYWPYGAVMCKLTKFAQAFAVYLSSYTLVTFSLDTYVHILFPFRNTMTSSQAVKVLGGVWLTALATALPILIVQVEVVEWDASGNRSLAYCKELWFREPLANSQAEFIYSIVSFLLQYLLPLAVIVFTYTSIWVRIWIQTEYLGESNRLATNQTRMLARKLIFMMFVISLLHAMFWLPLNAFNLLRTLCVSYSSHPWVFHIFWGCHLVAMGHSLVNPIIYATSRSRYREGFVALVKLICPYRKTRVEGLRDRLSSLNSSELIAYRCVPNDSEERRDQLVIVVKAIKRERTSSNLSQLQHKQRRTVKMTLSSMSA